MITDEHSEEDPYDDRLQTKTKHLILKGYLQELAYKVLNFTDLTYVDGFSGPWKTETEDFADSSFMIAIKALQQAQADMSVRGKKHKITLFLSERNAKSFAKLRTAVEPFNKPSEGFEIITYGGEFEDAIPEIQKCIGTSFPLIFIDPTGWTGFGLDKIKVLFQRPLVEVLVNFMFAFAERFVPDNRPETVGSWEAILGGPGWRERLDPELPPGLAAEKLFRETLKSVGDFPFVVSTRIDKSTQDRPHFFLVYGTKNRAGLKAFRDTEYRGLKQHFRNRAAAKYKKREAKTGIPDLFSEFSVDNQEAEFEKIIAEQRLLAANELLMTLRLKGPMLFTDVVSDLLQTYMIRETDVKNICLDLDRDGKIQNTWGKRPNKPKENNIIELASNG